MNELFSWGSWRKVAYLLKSDSRRKTTIAFLARRLSHGISFDQVFLKEFSFKKLRPANGKTVTGGKPHLSWKLPINHMVLRVTIDLSQYPLETEHSSAKGIQIELMSPQGHGVRLYKTLYEGKWFWRLRAYLGREEVARSPVQVFQVESKNKTLGRLPSHIKLYSSQTPSSFFPIGVLTDNLKGIDELKQVGFNSVHHYLKYPDMLQKALEKLASVGMKALLTAPDTKEKTSFYNFQKGGSVPSTPWLVHDRRTRRVRHISRTNLEKKFTAPQSEFFSPHIMRRNRAKRGGNLCNHMI
jgi:hypothetical protein